MQTDFASIPHSHQPSTRQRLRETRGRKKDATTKKTYSYYTCKKKSLGFKNKTTTKHRKNKNSSKTTISQRSHENLKVVNDKFTFSCVVCAYM